MMPLFASFFTSCGIAEALESPAIYDALRNRKPTR